MAEQALISFSEQRTRLLGLAYRMLGSKADAEDVLQDAWLRWRTVDAERVSSPAAWLTTAVTRLSIDRLRRMRVERESYFGPWLPEPLSERDLATPETAAERSSDVSIAFLVLLESLGPEERAAFVLHDVLDEDYADIAAMLGKSEAACRQMVHRARQRVAARRRRFTVDDATRIRVLERLIEAMDRGDRRQLVGLLAEDATLISDGGGKAVASIRPLLGAERIAWLWFAVARRAASRMERRIVLINGEPGILTLRDGRLHSVSAVETDGRLVHAQYNVVNPEKLGSFANPGALRAYWPRDAALATPDAR
ncbi:MAG TPA: RNA polymerase sigma factor SigJ [Gammaproteobacteria bacterium]